MRGGRTAGLVATAALALAACSSRERKETAADNKVVAQHYVPPSVTSRLDYGAQADRRFRRLDRNGDGQLTTDELPANNPGVAAFDVDGDSKVSQQEFSQGMMKRFDTRDTNNDGSLTSDERRAAKE